MILQSSAKLFFRANGNVRLVKMSSYTYLPYE